MAYDPTQPVPPGYPPAAPGYPLPEGDALDLEPRYSDLSPDAEPAVGFGTHSFWQRLGLTGKATLLVGLLTLLLFFLPWYTLPDPNGTITFTGLGSQNGTYTVSNRVTQSGFGIALGVEEPLFNKVVNENLQSRIITVTYKTDGSSPPTVALYLYLWLVPLGALGLIATAWFLAQRRISSRLAAMTLAASSALSLLLEVSFLVAVNSAESNTEHIYSTENVHLTSPIVAVAWGFWLAWAVAVLGLGAGIYLLRQKRPHPIGQ